MSIFTKKVISDKALLLWTVLCAISSIVCVLVGGIIVYFIYNCWPIARVQMGGVCISKIQPEYLQFLPFVIGIIVGTLLTIKFSKT